MPASSGDPISAALTHSLAASSKFSSGGDSLDTKLIGSAKRVLMTEIKYEQTSCYNNCTLELKSKYIVLKPSVNSENGEVKLKNGLLKVKDGQSESQPSASPSNSLKTSTSVKLSSNSVSGATKCDAVLPLPKKVLFPPEKIQLGWQSKGTPIGSGMINMGNTCYLNSTLQALFHVPAFVNWLLNDKAHKDRCETTNGVTATECLICALLKTLKSSMENSASSNPIRPHLVYNKLKLICKRLIHGHQEDAHEFLRHLIESMDRSYLRLMQANNLDSYSKETSPLSQIFGGYLRTEVRCLECGNISLTFQHFQDLLLDIRQAAAVDDALESYFSCERLGDGEEAYKCDKCHRRVAATKKFALEKPPNVLCIQLKRFGIMGGKNSKHILVQQSLDLSRYWVHRMAQPLCRLSYRLVSLVSHIGPSSSCGHYTAIGATASGQFYLFDDSVVRPVSNHVVSGNNTYIIMYELSSPNPSIAGTPAKSMTGNCTVTKPSQTSAVSVNGTSSLANGNGSYGPARSLPSTPLKAILNTPAKPSYSNASCTKSQPPPSASSPQAKSLVPYSAESSDSESEPTSSKLKSTALTPVKNGLAFAKENSSSAKFSNCPSNAQASSPCKTSSVSGNVSKTKSDVLVNGWHVTEVPLRNGSPSDRYSPPQNWDVIDTSKNKNAEKGVESSQPKPTPYLSINGVNGKDVHRKPLENGHSSHEEAKKLTNGVLENGRVPNGKSWDGNRNNGTVDFLRKTSHQGYGSNVLTWNGSRTQVDREAENDRILQRKRTYDQMYEDDYDQGKVKKTKNNHYQKNGVREMNGRRNFFQEHQNHKIWYNDRCHSYRTYSNNRNYNRPYNSNFHWRR